jgi:beta-lactam-binding protein with PASTA domain
VCDLATVPNVVGLDDGSAQSAITAAGLRVGSVSTTRSCTVPAGNVISQNPHAGTHVAGNTAVSLTESAGKGPGVSPSFCPAGPGARPAGSG